MIAIRYQTPFETIELREGETAKSLSPVGEVYLSSIPDEIKVNDNQVFPSDERTVECSGAVRISIRDGEQWHQYLVRPVYPLMEEKTPEPILILSVKKRDVTMISLTCVKLNGFSSANYIYLIVNH